MYKALYPKIEIKAGGRVDRPSSRSVTSQLMCCLSGKTLSILLYLEREGPRYGTYRVNKVRIKCITTFISSHHSEATYIYHVWDPEIVKNPFR